MQTHNPPIKALGRVFTFIVGIVALAAAGVVFYSAVVALKTGEIEEISKRHADMVTRRDDSLAFWFAVGLRIIFGLFIAYVAVPFLRHAFGKRDDAA